MATPSDYREIPPPPELAPWVACLWTRSGAPGHVQRVVPDGCVDVLWYGDADGTARATVAGPDTVARLAPLPPGTRIAGVRFRPGAGPAALGVPLHVLRDSHVPLADVWDGPAARALAEQGAASGRPEVALARAVAARLAPGRRAGAARAGADAGTRAHLALAAALSASSAPGTVRHLADRIGLSERHLHRRCLDAFGYGPKTAQRILRFQAALTLARAGHRLADVAARSGYADQPHMARDVRALAGVPLTELLAR